MNSARPLPDRAVRSLGPVEPNGGRGGYGDRYALWLGQLVSEAFLREHPAASPAGNRWQGGLLAALREQGHHVVVRGCTPEPAWPGGRLFAPRHQVRSGEGELVGAMDGFLNLPLAKLLTQYVRLRASVDALSRRSGVPLVAFSYNVGLPEAWAARWLQKELGTPWVSVIADFPGTSEAGMGLVRKAMTDRYSRFQRDWVAEARARVYLSWSLYQSDPSSSKLHLEGGVTALRQSAASTRGNAKVLMFAGSLSTWTGIEPLLAAMRQVTRPCELWISGRGPLANLVREAAGKDSRIRYFGLVGEAELDHLMRNADVFVNPRPTAVLENRFNFPSKLLDYFSWGRPVISTLTPGMPPVYASLVHPILDETPSGMAKEIDAVLSWTEREREEAGERIHDFVSDHLLWSAQAERLWRWIEANGLLSPV